MLVTLEGIDGSGKTTAMDALRKAFPNAVFTSEPTGSWYGEAVNRSILTPDADPLSELFLYMADHAYHLHNTILPAIETGSLVISDRYIDSRYAYQSVSLDKILPDPLTYLKNIHQPWTLIPDLTLYFDISPIIGAKRSGSTNKFEQVSFLTQVHHIFEKIMLAEPGRFKRIDASLPPEELALLAIESISSKL
jgi:dTMP kinase